ncbi:MAG: hypothetical protein KC933_15815 [Myxococcales bacterium]|nr:hypothetical protein [Myxococcales bacterium]
MTHDAIDEALARVSERSRPETPIDDGLLLAYNAGELAPAAAEAVERRLARDPEARALLKELSRPLDEDLARRVERIHLGGRRRSPWFAGVVALAAVALFAVVSLPPAPSAPMEYALEVEGLVAVQRGGVSAAPSGGRLEPGSRLTVRLLPRSEPDAVPSLKVWLVGADGRLRAADAGDVTAKGGAFRFSAEAAALFPGFGHYELVLHLASTPDDLAALDGMTRDAAQRTSPGLGWWSVPLEYAEAAL